jgi:hypothetical protein
MERTGKRRTSSLGPTLSRRILSWLRISSSCNDVVPEPMAQIKEPAFFSFILTSLYGRSLLFCVVTVLVKAAKNFV